MKSNIKLNLGVWNSVFAVPSVVVDNYIKLAGGNNLKVLLFVLKNAGNEISIEEIYGNTGVSPDDAGDALLFWEQAGLLTFGENEITPRENETTPIFLSKNFEKAEKSAISRTSEKTNEKTSAKINEEYENRVSRTMLEREPRFNPKEIARAVRDDKGMDYLFKECERIFGRTLKHNEQNSLLLITEETGIPAECALMLVEYCFSVGKATPAYMKTIAVDWLVRGINSIDAVEEEIKALKEINSFERRLKKLFEMNGAFSKTQKDFIKKWSNLGFEDEMLWEAYQITLDKTGKPAFAYMDKIITKWSAEGIRNKEQLEKSQKLFKEKNKKTDDADSSFDINLITKFINEK